ncbi:unnamed protein product, partial [marine sediment metagenome]
VKNINSLVGRDIPPDYKDQIDDIIAQYDLHYRRPATIKMRESRAEFVERLKAENAPIPIPVDDLKMLGKIPLNKMTVNDLEDLRDNIAVIVHLGQFKNKLIASKEIRDLRQTVKEITDHLYETRKITPIKEEEGFQPPSARKKTKAQQAIEAIDHYLSIHRKVEFIAYSIDGFKTGPTTENVIQPIQDAGSENIRIRYK